MPVLERDAVEPLPSERELGLLEDASTSSKVPFPNPLSSKRETNFFALSFSLSQSFFKLLALDRPDIASEYLDHAVEPVERERLHGGGDLPSC